jgi:hypothetical protein
MIKFGWRRPPRLTLATPAVKWTIAGPGMNPGNWNQLKYIHIVKTIGLHWNRKVAVIYSFIGIREQRKKNHNPRFWKTPVLSHHWWSISRPKNKGKTDKLDPSRSLAALAPINAETDLILPQLLVRIRYKTSEHGARGFYPSKTYIFTPSLQPLITDRLVVMLN